MHAASPSGDPAGAASGGVPGPVRAREAAARGHGPLLAGLATRAAAAAARLAPEPLTFATRVVAASAAAGASRTRLWQGFRFMRMHRLRRLSGVYLWWITLTCYCLSV